MSSQRITRDLHCANDCRQTGCPGHMIELIYNHTSDTVTIMLDNAHYSTFDKAHWRALVNMDEELRSR